MEASEETNRQSSEEGSSTSETPAASVSVAPAPPAATASVATASAPAPAPASPAKTSTVKKIKPKKDPRRVAAGKRLAEFKRKARDGKRSESNAVAMSPASDPNKSNKGNPSPSSSFCLTQVLSVVSIVVSLAGLYYKREEARSYSKSVFLKQRGNVESKPSQERTQEQPAQAHTVSSIKSMD